MPDISQINLPNDNTTYDIADLVARGLIWQGTQTQYDAITTKDPSIVYFITDATGTSLAAVAMSGNYADLTNKPVIDTSLDTTSSNAIANGPVASFAESISSTVSNKMDKANPTGTGSLSLNRKANTATGTNSVTFGNNCEATANYSLAEGDSNKATGAGSHAEGYLTEASGNMAHAEGYGTIANRRSQHVFGEYNDADTGGAGTTGRGTYIEIVGKGTGDVSRSNARTLDWNGNEVLAGGLKVNGSQDVIPTEFSGSAKKISAWSNTTGSANIAITTSSGRQFVISINSSGVISGNVIDPT